jgi:hypothetical protein
VCWISQFQENGTEEANEKQRPRGKRSRDPVADPSLDPRTTRLRQRRTAPVVADAPNKVEKVKKVKKVEVFTFLFDSPIISVIWVNK